MRTIPSAFQAKRDSGATTLCRCWIIRRSDGMTQGFTDHDEDVVLGPAGSHAYAVRFRPQEEGDFETTASLFLDEDPDAQGRVTLRGRAVTADIHGGGGCNTGGNGGPGLRV